MDVSLESKPRVCFEVEKVIGVSNAGNVRSYQVRYAPVWVSGVHLLGCEHLIDQFIMQQEEEQVVQHKPQYTQQHKQNQQQQQQQHQQHQEQQQDGTEMEYPVVVMPSDSNDQIGGGEHEKYNEHCEDINGQRVSDVTHYQGGEDRSPPRDKQLANITKFSEQSIRVDGEDYTIVVGNSRVLPKMRDKETVVVGGEEMAPYDINTVKIEVEEDDGHVVNDTAPFSYNTTMNNDKMLHPPSMSLYGGNHRGGVGGNRASFLEMHDDSLADLKSIQTNILETHNPKHLQKLELCDSNITTPTTTTSSTSATSGMDDLFTTMEGEDGKPLFTCLQCGKTLFRRPEMQIHVRKHSGIKPYTCDTCGKAFSVKCSLKRHLRLHTGEKPFSCEKCDRRFTFHNQLKRHMVVHTEDIDVPEG